MIVFSICRLSTFWANISNLFDEHFLEHNWCIIDPLIGLIIVHNQPSELTWQIFLDEQSLEHNWGFIGPLIVPIYNFVKIVPRGGLIARRSRLVPAGGRQWSWPRRTWDFGCMWTLKRYSSIWRDWISVHCLWDFGFVWRVLYKFMFFCVGGSWEFVHVMVAERI